MGERRGTKALELWCRRVTEGYPGVRVENMTTSWRDGLAFCALIHHFRPDLIDFPSLKKEDVYHNNELAFRTAESYLGIPALLDAEDMAQYEVPDRLSILTYLSQYYQHFASADSPNRTTTKKSPSSPHKGSQLLPSPSSSTPATQMMSSGLGRREPCTSCGQPVFLAQRLVVERRLFHRTCFTCARCGAQLTLASYHHNTTDPEEFFCCETCPDEETDSLDEETNSEDQYSTSNQDVSSLEGGRDVRKSLEIPVIENSSAKNDSRNIPAEMTRSCLDLAGFIKSQFEENTPPALPTSLPPTELEVPSSISKVEAVCPSDDVPYTSNNVNNDELNNEVPLICSPLNKLTHSNSVSKVKTSDENFDPVPPVPMERSSNFPPLVGSPIPAPRGKHTSTLVNTPNVSGDQISILDNTSDVRDSSADNSPGSVPHDEKTTTKDEESILNEMAQAPSLVKSRMELFEKKIPEGSEKMVREQSELAGLDQQVASPSFIEKELDQCLSHNFNVKNEAIEDVNQQVVSSNEAITATPLFSSESQEPGEMPSLGNTSDESQHMGDQNRLSNDLRLDCVKLSAETGSNHEVHVASQEEQTAEMESTHDLEETNTTRDDDVKLSVGKASATTDGGNDPTKASVGSNSVLGETGAAGVEDRATNRQTDDLYPEELNPFSTGDDEEMPQEERVGGNPFGSCSEDEEEPLQNLPRKSSEKPPRPPPPVILVQAVRNGSDQKKKIIAPTSLNPFESDDDTEEESVEPSAAVDSLRSDKQPPSFHGSSSSLVGTQRRKKAPAPRPPTQQLFSSQEESSPITGTTNTLGSPQVSPRSRKRRPAPPPPTTSSPLPLPHSHHLLATSSPIISTVLSPSMEHSRNSSIASYKRVISAAEFDEQDWDDAAVDDREQEKEIFKSSFPHEKSVSALDSMTSSDGASITTKNVSNKHRKGPAPAVPRLGAQGIPVSAGALRRELALLEEQQRGLERQGVRLETLIRERTEGQEPLPDGVTDVETDELLLQLFDLVNEKNELFRRQAELMYLRKQQRLEEEQADLEQQVRVLMLVEESNKTDTDKQREEALLARLVEVVQRRDLVIAALDQERLREKAEDQAIRERMTLHRAKLEELSSLSSADTHISEKKEKKKKKYWMKKDKTKKCSEDAGNETDVVKRSKHKKWFK